MKRKYNIRCLVLVMAAVMLITGCASPLLQQPSEPDRGVLVLTDPQEDAPDLPSRPETPSADDPDALSGIGNIVTEYIVPGSGRGSADNTAANEGAGSNKNNAPSEDNALSVNTASNGNTPASGNTSPGGSTPPSESTSASGNAPPSDNTANAGNAPVRPASGFRNNTPRMQRVTGEVRGVWISFLEFDHLLRGRTREQFTANIRRVLDACADYGINTVIVQVRPFADALYPSAYFPWSHFATGTEGVDPGFDPLAIMIDEAHARGMRFEAWINPYRIRTAGSRVPMCPSNQAAIWLSEGNRAVINYNGIISYNPANAQARQLIVNGVVEIVRNYSVDAIHIDDYFYPTTSAGFDAACFNAYRNAGGTRSLADWRRHNVQTLMREMYSAIKAEDPNVLFGISPQSRIDYNFNNLYLDVARIASRPGYADYIMPQIYFGFEHATQPFAQVLQEWNAMVNPNYVRLYIGLAPYKSGLVDTWAGAGRYEWVNNTDLLARMVQASRAASNYRGFVLFRFDSLFDPAQNVRSHVEREHANLRAILN